MKGLKESLITVLVSSFVMSILVVLIQIFSGNRFVEDLLIFCMGICMVIASIPIVSITTMVSALIFSGISKCIEKIGNLIKKQKPLERFEKEKEPVHRPLVFKDTVILKDEVTLDKKRLAISNCLISYPPKFQKEFKPYSQELSYLQKTLTEKEFKFYLKDRGLSHLITDKISVTKKTDFKQIQSHKTNKKIISFELYVEYYLTPFKKWNNEISFNNKLKNICNSGIPNNKIENYIKEYLNFGDNYRNGFLNTLYWKTLAEANKIDANYKCRVCNGTINLCTHHRDSTYSRHGLEHIYWRDDLTCLCGRCHSNYHKPYQNINTTSINFNNVAYANGF